MSILDNVKSTGDIKEDDNFKFLIHGPPGVGKTHMIRTLPGTPIVASTEAGLTSLMDADIPYTSIGSMDELVNLYMELEEGDHPYTAVVLDSVSEIAEQCLSDQKEEHAHGQAAYGEMQDRVMKMLRKFRALDMLVYFSAKQMRQSVNGEYLRVPYMPGRTLVEKRPIAHDFDYVFSFELLEKDDEVHRVLRTERSDGYEAKARDPYGRLGKFERADLGNIIEKLTQEVDADDD